jgi:Bacteriocin-protection, YdeI or OmpD-Associated/Domain of unknown function (DUF1905)
VTPVERFEATVEARGRGGRVVVVPLDVPARFGKVRAPVRGTVNGFPYRSTIMRYRDTYFLGLNREVREGAGVDAGDRIEVEMELDDVPREVDVPDELASALGVDPAARTAFESLSYTHRKEYARWVGEAKRDETRRRRVEKAIAMLRDGVRTPAN